MLLRLGTIAGRRPIQIPQQGFQGNLVRLRTVSDGVVRRDVTAGAMQPVAGKDENSLGMIFNDFLDQVIRSDLPLQPGFAHLDLAFQAQLVSL